MSAAISPSGIARWRFGVPPHARRIARSISGQRQLSFQRRDASSGGGQLVGLHTRDPVDDAGVDECLTPPLKSWPRQIPVSPATAATVHPAAASTRFAGAPSPNTHGASDLLMITLPTTLTTAGLQHGHRGQTQHRGLTTALLPLCHTQGYDCQESGAGIRRTFRVEAE